ncbi:hypothetical protein CRG98_018321 [Punica granatum]|uniref:Uncharacterized protein n=1 Tax=Punica granatum TaxID=22663 RepID=A0A2I0JYD0_PUNGR|nr:hypothetical protein CRG98_018321 [Punica granatum]
MQRQVPRQDTFGFKSAYHPRGTLHGSDNARSGAAIVQDARHRLQRSGHPRPTFTRRQPWSPTLLGIPKGNGQVIYSDKIPDRLSYRAQPSKADSSSSTAGDQARNPNSSRQLTPIEGRKRRGAVSTPFWPTDFLYENPRPKPGLLFITRQPEANMRAREGNQRSEQTTSPENSRDWHCGTIHHQITEASKGAQYGTRKIPLGAKVTNDTSGRVSEASCLSRDTPEHSQTPSQQGSRGARSTNEQTAPETGLHTPRTMKQDSNCVSGFILVSRVDSD